MWDELQLSLGLLLHELCQIYLSFFVTIDKNEIKANLSTYSAPCGMMSKSTALVNSCFTWLWLWVHRDNNKNYDMCAQFCNVCHPCKVLSIKSRIQGMINTDWTTGSPSSKYEHWRTSASLRRPMSAWFYFSFVQKHFFG